MSFLGKVASFFAIMVGLLAVALMMAPAEYRAWTMFMATVATGNWDPCFFRNTFVASLFMEVHRQRLGSNPVPVEPTHVRELPIEQFSWEALREASQNFREPVIVRGLFSDSKAVKTWSSGGMSAVDRFNVTVVQNSTVGKDHYMNCGQYQGTHSVEEIFHTAFSEIKAYDPNSGLVSKTMIIPPASRSNRRRDPELDEAMRKMIDEDLELSRIGGAWHKGAKNAALVQLFIGAGDAAGSQGTGMHGDMCNNQIIQIAGVKNWTWIHPRHSALLRPTMLTGKTAISGVDLSSRHDVVPFLPRMEATMRPGDFLYNPDWYWHKVHNEAGFTMAVVARECNMTQYMRGSPVMSSLVLTNHIKAALFGGDAYALERIKAAIMKSSLQSTSQ